MKTKAEGEKAQHCPERLVTRDVRQKNWVRPCHGSANQRRFNQEQIDPSRVEPPQAWPLLSPVEPSIIFLLMVPTTVKNGKVIGLDLKYVKLKDVKSTNQIKILMLSPWPVFVSPKTLRFDDAIHKTKTWLSTEYPMNGWCFYVPSSGTLVAHHCRRARQPLGR